MLADVAEPVGMWATPLRCPHIHRLSRAAGAIAASQRCREHNGADDHLLNGRHGAEIVVEQNARTRLPCRERSNMAAQEALQARIEEEAQEDPARVAQHHDEGHQWPAGATDGEMAEVTPVDLALLGGQGAQP